MNDLSDLMSRLVEVTEQRDASYELLQGIHDALHGHEHNDPVIQRIKADVMLFLNEAECSHER